MSRALPAFFLLLLAWCCAAPTAAATYEPARFPADQSPITGNIRFPPSEDIQVQVQCLARVARSGRFSRSWCFSTHPDGSPFVHAVIMGIDNTRIEPARIDGRTVSVELHYTVRFDRRAGLETIELFPFHFSGERNPGAGYTAPQRFRGPLKRSCSLPHFMWYSMTIPVEGGRPLDVKHLNPEDGTFCEKRTRAILEGSQYLPAFLDGKPVSAPHRELWWRD